MAHLVAQGQLDASSADRALHAQRQSRQRIDIVLSELALLSTADLRIALSEFCGMPQVVAEDFPLEPLTIPAVKPSFLRQVRMVPLRRLDDGVLLVATDDPFAALTIKKLGFWADMPTAGRLALSQDIDQGLNRLYPDDVSIAPSVTEASSGEASAEDLQRLLDIASEAPTIRLVNRLIGNAASRGASDVHIECLAGCVRVRYRIDGRLTEVERLPPSAHASIATRIKVLAKLNIAERRLPQDGRTSFVLHGRAIDLRVSTTPTLHGESLVIRVLDKSTVDFRFESLGLEPRTTETLQSLLSRPNGMLLITGPTGSGKTTTLYTALLSMNSMARKIFSVEDPIEYELTGINQTQVKPAIGLDFPQALRSILRQDPDVIMIGEMRDAETARIGIQAALTGHFVLATLHTNSAAAAVTRLLNMGCEDYLLASTLNGIIAQRLVRRLCEACAEPSQSGEVYAKLRSEFGSACDLTRLRKAVGCPLCNGTGYKGRTAISEVIIIDEAIRPLVRRGAGDHDIQNAAHAHGMLTLKQSGFRKVLTGETTIEEIMAVVVS